MGTCQNNWLVTGPLAHTRYIPRYIGYVTEGGCRDIPKDFCAAEDMKAARQGVCNRLAFQGVCNRGLVAWNATIPLFDTPPYRYCYTFAWTLHETDLMWYADIAFLVAWCFIVCLSCVGSEG